MTLTEKAKNLHHRLDGFKPSDLPQAARIFTPMIVKAIDPARDVAALLVEVCERLEALEQKNP